MHLVPKRVEIPAKNTDGQTREATFIGPVFITLMSLFLTLT